MRATMSEKLASAEDALHEVSKLRSIVTDAMGEGVRSANHAITRSRDAAEDLLEDIRHRVKRRPMECVSIAFGAGILTGAMIAWLNLHRR